MTLTLTLANVDSLENGEVTRLVLDRHGALIGRSPNADWSLPDSKKHISFTHCEIVYRGGAYLLVDKSTNGTFLNGARERMGDAHTLANGDEFAVGPYRVLVNVASAAPQPKLEQPAPQENLGWGEPKPPPREASAWDATPAAPAPPWPGHSAVPSQNDASAWGDLPAAQPRKETSGWDDLPAAPRPAEAWPEQTPGAAISGRGPMSENWAAPRPVAVSPQPRKDVWARYEDVNKIDWGAGDWNAAPAALAPSPQAQAPAPVAASDADQAWRGFLAAAGIDPAELKAPAAERAAAAGLVLRRLVAGLVVMLEARARAKAELGAGATMVELNGNNPLKFLRHPEAALTRLLNPPERGYMEAERAVDDGFKDLQAHQMASLAAMQGALRATLARFSPGAIRSRAESRGLLARILPGSRDAALWQAYEREFEGVVKDSDEAFMDFFSKAFREAYQKASSEMRR
jgi:type VI secretion system FHA domain protein